MAPSDRANTLLTQFKNWARVILPAHRPGLAWRDLRPRGAAQWLSVVLLWLVFLAYGGQWLQNQWGALFDPLLQNDDARTALFPFHRYGPEGALRDDPLANDMLFLSNPLIFLLYRVLTPLVGLLYAVKVVQGLCYAILFWAGLVLVRSRRVGLAAGVLLVFMVLHSPGMVNRIAGGFGRGFAFPALALWIAGALTRSVRVRVVATLIGAATYAPVMMLLLAAEGLFLVADGISIRSKALWQRLGGYGILVVACLVLIMPQLVATRKQGHLQTLAQAQAEPAFFGAPRFVLPFPDPAPRFLTLFVSPFAGVGMSPAPGLAGAYAGMKSTGPLLLTSGLLLLVLLRVTPGPRLVLPVVCGSVIIYFLARVLAFRLYNPDRYCTIGMPAAMLALTAATLGLVAPHARAARRAVCRNLAATGFIVLLWVLAGNGPGVNAGTTIDRRDNAALYDFAESLPVTARIAVHPLDGAGIGLWSARATTDHYETLQPFVYERWQEYKARTHETLTALYATDRTQLLAYCRAQHITHLLIHAGRYREDFKVRARSFEPFTTFTDDLLAKVDLKDLVVPQIPPAAVLFQEGPFAVVDVEELRRSWGPTVTPASAPFQ